MHPNAGTPLLPWARPCVHPNARGRRRSGCIAEEDRPRVVPQPPDILLFLEAHNLRDLLTLGSRGLERAEYRGAAGPSTDHGDAFRHDNWRECLQNCKGVLQKLHPRDSACGTEMCPITEPQVAFSPASPFSNGYTSPSACTYDCEGVCACGGVLCCCKSL